VSDLLFGDPALIFALHRESTPFVRLFPPHQRFRGAPCRARFCGPAWLTVLVLEAGVGARRARRVIDWLLARPMLGNVAYRPRLVLSVGFCGALVEEYQAGDVILATEVVDEAGQVWPATWPGELPDGEWRPPLQRGRVLTVPRLAATVEDKRGLAARHGAIAVDMESAVLAAASHRQQIPFGCVRAVSDDARTPLPPRLLACLEGGRVAPFRLLATLAGSPGLFGEMRRLARQTRHAAEQLAAALGELLTLTLPWGREL
jgi:adenosylhomocysteine nucleosidase